MMYDDLGVRLMLHGQEMSHHARDFLFVELGMSRAAAKHTTVAERKCTTGGMGDGSDLGVGVGTGTVGRGLWED